MQIVAHQVLRTGAKSQHIQFDKNQNQTSRFVELVG